MNETRVASLAPAPGRWSAASAALLSCVLRTASSGVDGHEHPLLAVGGHGAVDLEQARLELVLALLRRVRLDPPVR